ncbi:MAG: MFS transporter [Candidatus Eisenbacteria bacterium]|nr:MFS transporter [Candidatus Eisenbacteria bacterium]
MERLAPSGSGRRPLHTRHEAGMLTITRHFARWPRPVWFVMLGWVVNATGFAMVIPFMSLYFHQVLGVPMRYVAVLFLVTGVVRAVSGAWGGRLSDRWGRRPLLILAPAGRSAAFLGVAYLVWREAAFIPTAALLVVTFFMAAAYQPVGQAVVADVVAKERRLQAYAWTRVAMNLGWGLGPALGGYLSQVSFALLFLIGAGLAALTSLLLALGVPETAPHRTGAAHRTAGTGEPPSLLPDAQPLRDRRFLHYSIATLFLYLLMAQLVATLPVYAVEWVGISKSQLGHLFTLNGLLVVLFQTTLTRILRRYPVVLVQSLGALAYAVLYFSMATAHGFAALVVLISCITFSEMAVTPGTVTVISNMAPADRMGHYMGIFGLFSSAAWSFGPFIGGLLLDLFPHQPYALWSAVAVLGIASSVGYLSFRLRRGDYRA